MNWAIIVKNLLLNNKFRVPWSLKKKLAEHLI